MVWIKPDDLALIAECETLPEAEIIIGLLQTADIQTSIVTTTDSTVVFSQKSIFGELAKPKPYKILVRPEDAETAKDILTAIPEDILEEDE